MCYTGLCQWEQTSGPDVGECTWQGWQTDGWEKAPCPEPSAKTSTTEAYKMENENKLKTVEQMRVDLLRYIVTEIEVCPTDVSVDIHFFRPSDELVEMAADIPGFIKIDEYYESGGNLDGGSTTLYLDA